MFVLVHHNGDCGFPIIKYEKVHIWMIIQSSTKLSSLDCALIFKILFWEKPWLTAFGLLCIYIWQKLKWVFSRDVAVFLLIKKKLNCCAF